MGGAWHFRALLIWLALLGLAYWGFDHFLAPKVARVSVAGSATGEVTIPRSADGHYYVAGSINGRALTFLVDTGASTVAVSADFARNAGLPRGYPLRFETANGSTEGELVPNQTVEAGGLRVTNIDVGVGVRLGAPDSALLGQSFLRHVDVLQSGDQLVLKARQ